MDFQSVNASYTSAKEICEQGLTVLPVSAPEIAEFDHHRIALHRTINQEQLSEIWQRLAEVMARFHARIARTPCSPKWIYENDGIRDDLLKLNGPLKVLISNADPSLKTMFQKMHEHFMLVIEIEESPLIRTLADDIEQAQAQPFSVIVLNNQRMQEQVCRELLELTDAPFEIRRPVELRSHDPIANLYLTGPPHLMEFRGQGHLLRAPIGQRMRLLMMSHERLSAFHFSLLGNGIRLKLQGHRPSVATDTTDPYEQAALESTRLYGSIVSASDSTTRPAHDPDDTEVTAKQLILGNGQSIFFDIESSVYTVETRHTGGQTVCTDISKTKVTDLEPDMLVILTTRGGGDLVAPIADRLLGKISGHYHRLQKEWKDALNKQIKLYGIETVCGKLDNLGAQNASITNVKNWCLASTIAPHDLEEDFGAVLQLIEAKRPSSEYVIAIRKLRGAHQSAGMRLQSLLRNSIKGQVIDAAFRDGALSVEADESGPAKTIYLIQGIGKPVVVSRSLTNFTQQYDGE